MPIAPSAIITILAALVVFPMVANDAYSHSMNNPFAIYTQTYFMKPGDTLTSEARVCAMLPIQLTVNNVTFSGNNSNWVQVNNDEFPLSAAPAANGTASVSFPVTVTVPANFTGDHALVQTVVGIQDGGGISLPLDTSLRIIITDSSVAPQNLPACTSLMETQRTLAATSLILGSSGAGLGAVGFFAYSRSKAKSAKNKASIASKVLLVLLATFAFFLISGAILFWPR